MRRTLQSQLLHDASSFSRSSHALDPDARTRVGVTIDTLDTEADEALMQEVWGLVRIGRLSEAASLCQQSKQPWRAASLLTPMRLWSVSPREGEAQFGTSGNRWSLLWRDVCKKAAEHTPSDLLYERALLGLYGGNTENVLPLCRNWEDLVWASFKTKADERLFLRLKEEFQRFQHPSLQHTKSMVCAVSLSLSLSLCVCVSVSVSVSLSLFFIFALIFF